MRRIIIHPLWTHLPAAIALAALITGALIASPFSGSVPVHFSASGEPNGYGSAWSVFGLVIGLCLLYILLSVLIDELWARQERAKTFNWLCLFDDIIVGAMAGIYLGYLAFLRRGDGSFVFPWSYLLLTGGSAVILAIILEMLRPHRPYLSQLAGQDSRDLQMELKRRLKDNSPFVYWDYQNPLYVTLLTTLLPLVMLASGVVAWFSLPAVGILLGVISLLMILPYGGMRVLVTRQSVAVRFGILGLRVLRLPVAEIAAVETQEFAPLRDFGGYGIRFNREMQGYFLGGNRGVKLTTTSGKKYLIGSYSAERLAAVISAARQAQ